ncbi:hypothetical protein CVT26_009825 [Gymnopilus dilepis]|uniref:DNA 3'-5' helicase n=1 Tax=Gymnopilus dilepis TaxID=231916 RepID=A0A409VKU1_9AGAR|nr:hypothetical protein CVT26_009825 [Gymnopilus dilepis]
MPAAPGTHSFARNGIPLSPDSQSLSAARPVAAAIKKSKFKPAIPSSVNQAQDSVRRAGLTAFRTPGFQTSKASSSSLAPPRNDVVYVSSDSSPSTPGQVKRDSSGLSVIDEPPPHPPKRQKVAASGDKENILGNSSKANQLALPISPKNSDLDTESLETLTKYKLYTLATRSYVMDESLAFHSSKNTDKDPILLEQLNYYRQVIDARLQAIELAKTGHEGQRIKNQSASETGLPSTTIPAPAIKAPSNAVATSQGVLEVVQHLPSIALAPTSGCSKPTASVPTDDERGSDDGYWNCVEDIPMQDTVVASTSNASSPPLSTEVKSAANSHGTTSLSLSPYYNEIMDKLRGVFKLSQFRTNQLEAITAALDGRDVFVLMPTGGGKSLCFQLPALCTSGKTKGVTVVVSPLLALMKDQVDNLHKKRINALLSNAETVGEDWQQLVKSENKPDLWYVTPEKLRDSPKVNEILSILYRNQKLARFVIDEAHCISTWGQDFRDAYTALGSLREKYPSVPIMALTATANRRTVADIVLQLRLKDHASFTQSFNRPNLKYYVKNKKGESVIVDIAGFIQSKHNGEAGVIYCNTRAKCESVAASLRERGLSAAHFHAGMPTEEKEFTVHSWQKGTALVIVATIAFGMGIDKADVRFVIHHDMPKSMSGYYQETGRAGRDGKPADCVMYYSGGDASRLMSQIKKTEGVTQDSIERQVNAVLEVMQFAQNTSECRRVQILRHFDEDFSKADCARGCDTCEADRELISTNVTQHAQAALTVVHLLQSRGDSITLPQLRAILRGSKNVETLSKQHDQLQQHGHCKELPKELLELMLSSLISYNMLTNTRRANRSGFHTDYLELGPNAQELLDNERDFVLNWHRNAEQPTKAPKRKKKLAGTESISAPAPRKGKKKAVIDDDPIEAPDDMYDWDEAPSSIAALSCPGPSHLAGPPPSSSRSNIVRPISMSVNGDVASESREEALYKRMLMLRNEIVQKAGVQGSDVLDDNALQWLSVTCPSDYHSFKRELANSMEMDDTDQLVNEKWKAYGQQFLELCIHHKAVADDLIPTTL